MQLDPISYTDFYRNKGLAELEDTVTDLITTLDLKIHSTEAIVHDTTVNTDCNNLVNGRHVVYTDGTGNAPTTAGLYLLEQTYITTETDQQAIAQTATRYSTGLFYTRIRRLNAWTAWNKVG